MCVETQEQVYVVWGVTLAASVLSLFGSSFMLVSFFLFGSGKGLSQLIIYLALGDYGWAIGGVIGYTILFVNPSLYTFDVCVGFRLIFQFFASSTVFWTSCIALFLYLSVFRGTKNMSMATNYETEGLLNPKNTLIHKAAMTIDPISNRKTTMMLFHVISWGVPLFFCIYLLAHKERDMSQDPNALICYPRNTLRWGLWFAPMLFSFFASITIYTALMLHLSRTMSWRFLLGAFRERSLALPYRVSLYLLVFLVCWTLDIIQFVIASFTPCNDSSYYMLVIYSFLLQSQGALDCLVYGLTNKGLRNKYQRRTARTVFIIIFGPILVIPSAVYYLFIREQKSQEVSKTSSNVV